MQQCRGDTGFKCGGGQDFLGTKKLIIRNRNRVFDLKYSKRVKIDD